MKADRFDLLSRTLGRRGAATALFGLAGLAPLLADKKTVRAGPIIDLCDLKPKGGRCRRDRQCCSHDCKRKKGKARGKCRCSPLGAACTSLADCCPPPFVSADVPTCSVGGASSDAICCMPEGAACQNSEDCCGGSACSGGLCEF
jgi:hypothetical protein